MVDERGRATGEAEGFGCGAFTAKFPGEVSPSLQQGDVDAPSGQQPGQGGAGRTGADYDDSGHAFRSCSFGGSPPKVAGMLLGGT